MAHISRRVMLLGVSSSALAPLTAFAGGRRAAQARSPRFIDELEFGVEEVNGSTQFRLRKDFGYIDSTGVRWQAKAGLLTDGASIPRIFWTIVGNPYGGLYLKAAVIHDYYCKPENRYRRWENVHRVFYDAMLANGVGRLQAIAMYAAVWRFGPRWDISAIRPCVPSATEFCASAKVSAYRLQSQEVRGFDEAAESQRLRDAVERIERQQLTLETVPEWEAVLPPLARTTSAQDIDANSDRGWFFTNPYSFPLTGGL